MKNQTPYAHCEGCGKHAPAHTLYDLDGSRVCLDCYSANAPMTPAPEEAGKTSDGAGKTSDGVGKTSDGVGKTEREILLAFLRAVANRANWGPQNQTGELRVWHPYPPLHVTARRLLEEMER